MWAWGALKLVYLYLQYWIVGLDEEGFQITKGNYLLDLGLYPAAAKAYKRALQDSRSPYVHASLGYCYLNMGMPDRAVQSLRTAYAKTPRADFGLSLAHSLLEAGETKESERLLALLKGGADSYTPEMRAELGRLEEALAAAAADRLVLGEHLRDASRDA